MQNDSVSSDRSVSYAGTSAPPAPFETLVTDLLQNMKRGRMTMEFPDGRTESFGQEPDGLQAHIQILDVAFFRRIVLFGDIGFGESFEAGEWTSKDVTAVIEWMILNIENNPTLSGSRTRAWSLGLLRLSNRISHFFRDNTLDGSKKNISAHYDLGNDFFQLFLDPTMTYSSADFESGATNLEQAQIAKYDRLCGSLRLQSNDHLLEIGTGWGGFSIYAARTYRCKITSVTISQEQYRLARERVAAAGLDSLVEIRLCDYRDITGSYDKIASIEMLEAVGARHLKTYFDVCNRVLKPNGLLGLQVILCPDSRFEALRKSVDWTQKHIFPGSLLPSMDAIHRAIRATSDLNLYVVHDMGKSYVRTLAEWRNRFLSQRAALSGLGLDESFIRRWHYYFSYCEGAFKTKNISVAQLLYARPNNRELAQ